MLRCLIICLFVSVGLNAQQQIFYTNFLSEARTWIPFDKVWCKANGIDSIRVNLHIGDGKWGKGKKYNRVEVFVLYDGRPDRVIEKYTHYQETGKEYDDEVMEDRLPGDLDYHNDPDYSTRNNVENSTKAVNVDIGQGYKQFKYQKLYYSGDRLTDVTIVKGGGMLADKTDYRITQVKYFYTGNLLDKVVSTYPMDDVEETQYECLYKAGQPYYVMYNDALPEEFEEGRIVKAWIIYYSKGKEVVPK